MMLDYWNTFAEAWTGYARYLGGELTRPHVHNYVLWLCLISLAAYGLELARPWRRDQPKLRRDFWLDAFYMFWNFFGFPLVIFIAVSAVVGSAFQDGLRALGLESITVLDVSRWPAAVQLVVMFILRDFIHWNVHRLLHRVPFLWELHKVHHSVVEMGFAAHLRYHWGETVVYRLLESIPLAAIGFGVEDFIVVHLLAKELPPQHRYGMNYGISLSLWDYLFGTAYVPRDGRDIELGFPEIDEYPRRFTEHLRVPPRARGS